MADNEAIGNIVKAVERLYEASAASTDNLAALRAAASKFAGAIGPLLPPGETLPRGYIAEPQGLVVYDKKIGYLITGDKPAGHSRESLQLLANDIAEGWLEELAAWLRNRALQDRAAAELLENAARMLISAKEDGK